ncbi:glycosyltransferase [Jiella sp. CQZ9-1]|uniref:Glycosyltransferase n=2 Tax=Jiella flava TaxID=2816857 RepID=A0A939FWZ3_9HYPH|nr:glycosyltransferase [Jiella flava]
MHIITNFTANAGAEGMLSRLLVDSPSALVVPIMDVADRYRNVSAAGVRFAPMRAETPAKALRAVPRIAALIRRERPDVILCWMYHAMVLGTVAHRLAGVGTPIFWNVRQSLDSPAAMSRSTRVMLWMSRLLSRTPDGVVYNSQRAADLHLRYGFRSRATTVIPNGFEPAAFATPDHERPKVFGIAARFHPQKDHQTFFAAAARLARRHPEVRFVAVGAGLEPTNTIVRQMMATSGLAPERISLRGETTDLTEFYREIDVLVLSSVTEGFPNVIAEAMGRGRPVVTTDVGEAARIVGDTGLVVRPGNPEMLANAMETMTAMAPEDYRQRALAARQRILDHYSLSSVRRQFETVLGTL